LVCALSQSAVALPVDIFDLYKMGIQATLARYCSDNAGVELAKEMLTAIAVSNHLAKRRTFQLDDIRRALGEKSILMTTWRNCLEKGEIPLIKILTLGEVSGEFQFSHLSFQESLFGQALKQGQSPSFWSTDDLVCEHLNDAFYRNALTIGRGHLGQALAQLRSTWNFNRLPRLTHLGREGLWNLLSGAKHLQELDLSNLKTAGSDELIRAVEVLSIHGLPALKKLVLRWCYFPAEASAALGTLLACCPILVHLDLECNPAIFGAPEVVVNLHKAIGNNGLQSLEQLSLRWCHVAKTAGPALSALLSGCPRLTEVDVLGSRSLCHDDLVAALPPTALLRGMGRRRPGATS